MQILTSNHPEAVPVCHKVATSRIAIDERLPPHADEEEALIARVGQHEHGEGRQQGHCRAGKAQEEDVALGAGAAAHFDLRTQ